MRFRDLDLDDRSGLMPRLNRRRNAMWFRLDSGNLLNLSSVTAIIHRGEIDLAKPWSADCTDGESVYLTDREKEHIDAALDVAGLVAARRDESPSGATLAKEGRNAVTALDTAAGNFLWATAPK